jgi:4-hydroxy-tetrahydrodipicolinate synthase
VPILVGITDTAFRESITIARYAADAGAQAVVSAGPYYLPAAQPELLDYVNGLVREQPLPLFIYNMPQLTKVHFDIETLRKLSHHEKIIGLKDSSADMIYFDKLVSLKKERPDWSVLIGPEHLLMESLERGGDGGVNGGANFHPTLFVELFEALKSRDMMLAGERQAKLLQLGQIYTVGQHASAVIKGMKCACSLLGICDDLMAEPFERFRPTERARIQAVLESLSLLNPDAMTRR